MKAFINRRPPAWWEKIIAWIVRWRLWIIVSIGIILTIAEIVEHSADFSEFNLFRYGEFYLLGIFLVIIAFLLEWLIRAIEGKTHTYAILEAKHQLAEKLDPVETWQELTDILHDFVDNLASGTIVDLLVSEQDSTELNIYSSGDSGGARYQNADLRALFARCQDCCLQANQTMHTMQSCKASQFYGSLDTSNGYCLPLSIENAQFALIHLYLASVITLSSNQVDVLNNVRSDIALAIKILQHRIASSEKLVFNTTVSTRSELSHDLHDTLGQNLSYLQFKLDQFTRDGGQVRADEIRPDLMRMHAVASESLDLLRETLIELQPDKQSRLDNYLREYGKAVGERANFSFHLTSTGTPILLAPSSQRQLSYVYREAINNIEKHAGANQVRVYLSYAPDSLTILIEDNGKGYDPESIQSDRHFGVKIMQERMAALNGSLCLDSQIGAGTRVTIWLPIEA